MRLLGWLIKILLFVVLFAFALNNQHDATLIGFFGREWQAPMALLILVVFAAGCVVGALAMLPAWWRNRRLTRRPSPAPPAPLRRTPPAPPTPAPDPAAAAREGL